MAAETDVFAGTFAGTKDAATETPKSKWHVPPTFDENQPDPFVGGGFEWEPGPGAKSRKKLKATSRQIPESKRTDDDFFNSESWAEPVQVIQYELFQITDTKEARDLQHEQARIKVQSTGNKQKPAKMIFIDVFWKTQVMTDEQLKIKGDNGRPLAGKRMQSRISLQLLRSLLKAAGQDENVVNGGFGAVPWDALVNRDVNIHIEMDMNMQDELVNRVQRFSKKAMGNK